MNTQEALKSITKYFQVKDFIIENSHLFSDTAFKVILNLYQRVDYGLENFLSVMSFTELRQRTGKTNQSIQRALKELEKKGLIIKISGKYQKKEALQKRAELYKQIQRPLRSYNETNAYDLTGLFILAGIYYKLLEFFDDWSVKEFFHQVRKYSIETGQPYLSIVSGVLIPSEIQMGMPIGIGVCLIGKSDMPIGKSDMPIGKSDMPIGKIPSSRVNANNTHTHHMPLPHNSFNENKNHNTHTNKTLLGNGNRERNSQGQAQKSPKPPEIEKELEEFILAELLKQEQEGKIKNANAILKTLTENDIEIYRRKFKMKKESQERQNYRVVVLTNKALAKAIAKKINAKIYENHARAYILCNKKQAKQIKATADSRHELCEIREYTADYEKYFS